MSIYVINFPYNYCYYYCHDHFVITVLVITPTRLFTTPPLPTVTQSSIPGESSDGLATGAVVGIVVGVLLGVLVSIIAIGISAW